jgi:2-polyprenyl-6-methoxyphenol hydroxylase-like FAD-dependent oxidoreductase
MKAVICGGGIAGLALAWWLERLGWDVLVVERAPTLRDEGYMIDFFGSGYDVADLMGLLPRLQELSYPVDEVRYVRPDGSKVSSISYRASRERLGGRLLPLMRGDLEHALADALAGTGVEIRFGCTVEAVGQPAGRVEVSLSDGTEHTVDLLVGADGIHSRVRALTFGPEQAFLHHLGYHTAAYVFSDPQLYERLGDRLALLTEPGRQAGFYALRGGRIASFLVHRRTDPTLPVDRRAEVRETYAGMGWIVDDALASCPSPPALYYDQVAQIVMPRWSTGRVVLVGDAAGAVSLLAGQGASMAMAGGCLLADALAANGADVQAALAAYETRLRPHLENMQRAGRRTAEWIAPTTRWRIAVRDTTLRVAALPGLSRILAPLFTAVGHSVIPRDRAVGVTGDSVDDAGNATATSRRTHGVG